MNEPEKERLIKKDIESIENRVRHAFNQGYEMGLKESKEQSGDEELDFVPEHKKIPCTLTIGKPCGDAISRQAVDTLVDELARAISDERCCMSRGRSTATIMQDILDLPSVTPQQRTGHWEWVRYDGIMGNWHCSKCRTIIPHMPEETDNTPIYKWCPMCGAKMQEVEE